MEVIWVLVYSLLTLIVFSMCLVFLNVCHLMTNIFAGGTCNLKIK